MISSDRQASQLLMSDLVENILRYSDNPGECARYVADQIRELIGVRSVAIISTTAGVENNRIAVCPQRKKDVWELPEVRSLTEFALNSDIPQIIDNDSDIGKVLATVGIGKSFIIPLRVGADPVGTIILLDLLDVKGATVILAALKNVAPILSLILRNSFLYANLERTVETRTAQLAKSEQLFRALFEQAVDGIFFLDSVGKIIAVNKSFAQSHGYTVDEIMRLGIEGLDLEGSAPVYGRVRRLFAGEALTFEVQHRHKDGHTIPYEINANLIITDKEQLILVNHRDISARKRAEEEHARYEQQLQLNSKLESLGILAGGIAHDFNNLMGGIFGYIDLAKEESDHHQQSNYLSKAMTTIDRARALTLQLLTFAKGGAPVQKVEALFPFVQETALFALSGSCVTCTFDVPADLWVCNFDKNQIGQVIDNLVINAQQSMPTGGTIELSARNCILADCEHPLLAKGNYVKVSVHDRGIGIPKEHLTRIFDPFFTTKTKGHGLGLATCYSIVNRHGGCIDVESEPGKGSTFRVYLPASLESAVSIGMSPGKPHKGSGTFLVMDDEAVMRETIGEMLSSFGYTVVCKENGADAVAFFVADTGSNRTITAIIFDLTVPGGMGGRAAVEEIRKVNLQIPVFVASGYAEDPVMKNPPEFGFTASMCKPFRKSELSEMLNRYL